MKGRLPKDRALAKLQGNTRHQAKDLPDETPPAAAATPESFFSSDPWDAPAWLSARGRAIWTHQLPIVRRQTRLQEASLPTFALYCDAVARFEEYTGAIAQHGATYTTKSGYRRKTPEVELRDRAANDVRTLAVELNLTSKSWIGSAGTFKTHQLELELDNGQRGAGVPVPAAAQSGAGMDDVDSFIGRRPTIQ